MAAMPLHLKRGLTFAAIEARQLAVSREESEPEGVACGTARCIGMDAVVMLATTVVGRLSNSSRVDRPPWPPCLASRKTQVLLLALRMLSGSVDMSRH